MSIDSIRKARRVVRELRRKDDIITHRGCPRCMGTRLVGFGSQKYSCQYYGYNKKHKGDC